ncbi:choice-of-anchor K domain-containing protein [Streptomyces sp. NPDC054854]
MHKITTSGIWPTVNGDGGTVTDEGTDHVKWGDAKSGYEFQGASTAVKLDGTEFTIGTFTHHNKRNTVGTSPAGPFTVDLAVDIEFENQLEKTFNFTFTHDETDNTDDPRGPQDYVILGKFKDPNTVEIDGTQYHVILSGFKQDGHITRRFVSPEDGSNSADIVAMFTAKNQKPKLEANVNRKGVNPGESDEYVELRNVGNAPLDLSGYTISGPNTDKKFTFPPGAKLEAGGRIRVYTNETHPETGGYSFNSPDPIWRNADQGEDTVQINPPH